MPDDIYEIDTDFSLDNLPRKKPSNTWSTKALATVGSGLLGIVVVVIAYALNMSNPSYKNASYDQRSLANLNPVPTPKVEPQGASLSGTLVCKNTKDNSCDPILLTEDGEVSLIGDRVDSLKSIPTGTQLVVYGITPTPDILKKLSGTPPILNKSKNNGSSPYPLIVTLLGSTSNPSTLIYPLISLTPSPSITPSITPTITPTPTISDPVNIREIVDASPGNDGDTLTVVGFIVNANVGEEACFYLYQCDFSTFVVNEDTGIDRDTHYDVTVKASKDEKESDYILNQKVKFKAVVVVAGGATTLEKLY
ncbi:hypothetical protein A3D77_06290 [Candidatus Gottesmanbacteria bacterium RIFCSPHIGHO2_02_FULL_39_11]|uniref:Uncharacterized protein n=1 Tax=Candidatus Gottesmanbacteria bacterium RIFCSPHIGHO2_02_FULL_39_11 TaxID=1798382 RepID=A0A1F5ZVU1_9BACT|nr:MAG: hypothetical protein A3D77_06290 [Candidatus Gottesmanbacteria bacterium RIFCSPHIGHO2_02_FULL_39_11]